MRRALFIPFANAAGDYSGFEERAAPAFAAANIELRSMTREVDPVAAVRSAKAIVVGGGSTWKLLKDVRRQGLLEAIRERVRGGRPVRRLECRRQPRLSDDHDDQRHADL